METGSTFKTLNITPCYNDKYLIFRENLKQCEKLVKAKYQKQIDYGLNTEDNKFFVDLRQKLSIIREILKQSENGSVKDIKLNLKK